MQLTYTKGWFRADKRHLELWDETKAKEHHDSGAPYTVLIGDRTSPNLFLEINQRLSFVGVNFLDEHLRVYLEYKFKGSKNQPLFLRESILRLYNGSSDEIIRGEEYLFSPDGSLVITEVNYGTNEKVRKEPDNKIDVSQNWEDFPQFGHYESIARKERS